MSLTSVSKDVPSSEPSYTAGRIVKSWILQDCHFGNILEVPENTKRRFAVWCRDQQIQWVLSVLKKIKCICTHRKLRSLFWNIKNLHSKVTWLIFSPFSVVISFTCSTVRFICCWFGGSFVFHFRVFPSSLLIIILLYFWAHKPLVIPEVNPVQKVLLREVSPSLILPSPFHGPGDCISKIKLNFKINFEINVDLHAYKNVHANVYTSFIHNIQHLEATKMSFNS